MTEVSTVQIILVIITIIATFTTTYFFYEKKKTDNNQSDRNRETKKELANLRGLCDKIEVRQRDLEKIQATHDYKFTTPQDAREIINEALAPIRIEFAETKGLIQDTHKTVSELSKLLAVQQALNKRRHDD